MPLETFLIIASFVFGCVWGSFFNVAIYRLPRGMSLVRPGSHCFSCNAPIAWYDNVPLVSWLVLRGRCRRCGAPFSFRYFVVELVSGLLFAAVMMKYVTAVTTKGHVLAGAAAVILHWLLVGGFVVLTFIDFDHKIIPDCVTIPGMILGLIASFAVPALVARYPASPAGTTHLQGLLLHGLIGLLVGGGIIWVIAVLGKAAFKKEAMGGGDLKLMAMIGAYMGWQLVLLVLFLAALVGTLVGVSLIVARRAAWSSQIPFGPYLVLGALIAFFFGPELIGWYFGLFHPMPEPISLLF